MPSDKGYHDLIRDNELKSTDKKNISNFVNHLKQTNEDFKFAFKEQKLNISITTDMTIAMCENFYDHAITRFKYSLENKGKIHKNQIRTFANIVKEKTQDPNKNGVAVGGCLSGKTGTANLLLLSAPIMWQHTGVWYVPTIVVPGKKNMEDQTYSETTNFCNLYGDLTITHNGKSITFNKYMKDLSELHPEISDLFEDRERKLGGTSLIMRRNLGENMMYITELIKVTKKSNMRNIFIMDEVHQGAEQKASADDTKRNGTQYKILAPAGIVS